MMTKEDFSSHAPGASSLMQGRDNMYEKKNATSKICGALHASSAIMAKYHHRKVGTLSHLIPH